MRHIFLLEHQCGGKIQCKKGQQLMSKRMLLQLSVGSLTPGGWGGGRRDPSAIKELLEDLCIFSLLCSSFNKTSVLASADKFT